MQSIELRPPVAVEPLNPSEIMADPGPMTQLYYDARQSPEYPQGYPDGMSLVCAEPRKPYPEIVEAYVAEKDQEGFDPRTFWDANFITPGPDEETIISPEGMDIESYTRLVRPTFMKTETRGHFDIRLPYPYPGAGGRFNFHLFPNDAYHIMKGYASTGDWEQVLDIVDNFEYQINLLGRPLNGNALFYDRFQSPYFSHSVRMLYEKFGDAALIRYLPALEREYGYHMTGKKLLPDAQPGTVHKALSVVRMPNSAILNTNEDGSSEPRLESYKEDVDLGNLVVSGLSGEIRRRRLEEFNRHTRGGAGTSYDFNSAQFKDGKNIETICTTDRVQVMHNCLMVDAEETLAIAWEAQAKQAADPDLIIQCLERSAYYQELAENRKAAIREYMWDPVNKIFRDYDFVDPDIAVNENITMVYPLYIGMANKEETFGVAKALEERYLKKGGFVTSMVESGEQWDGRRAWAPPNWAASRGVARMAHSLRNNLEITDDEFEWLIGIAEAGRSGFMHAVETAHKEYGIIPEKMDGEDPTQLIGGGEYAPVKVLNMTLETYNALKAWNPRETGGCLPIGRLALTSL
jgi:alpha,alpha-trehalase